jgi:hypothetical protein
MSLQTPQELLLQALERVRGAVAAMWPQGREVAQQARRQLGVALESPRADYAKEYAQSMLDMLMASPAAAVGLVVVLGASAIGGGGWLGGHSAASAMHMVTFAMIMVVGARVFASSNVNWTAAAKNPELVTYMPTSGSGRQDDDAAAAKSTSGAKGGAKGPSGDIGATKPASRPQPAYY